MHYWVYGFPVRSEIELPELREAEAAHLRAAGDDVVEIRVGAVPETLPDEVRLAPWLAFAPGQWLISISSLGRILVQGGERVIIDKAAGALESDLRSFILGGGMGALLHQRGQLPLHVSAILTPKGAIAFTGRSGAGKSTAVATLSDEFGWPIISDDVAVLVSHEAGLHIEGGPIRLRLWSDAIDRLGWTTNGLVRDFHRREKFLVYELNQFVYGPQKLIGLYEIDSTRTEGFQCFKGAERFKVLMNSIYRPEIAVKTQSMSKLVEGISSHAARLCCASGPRPDIILTREFLDQLPSR